MVQKKPYPCFFLPNFNLVGSGSAPRCVPEVPLRCRPPLQPPDPSGSRDRNRGLCKVPSFRDAVALWSPCWWLPRAGSWEHVSPPHPRPVSLALGGWGEGVVPTLGVSGFRASTECPRDLSTGLKLLGAHFLICEIRLPTPLQGGCEGSPRPRLRVQQREFAAAHMPPALPHPCIAVCRAPRTRRGRGQAGCSPAAPSLPVASLRDQALIVLHCPVRPAELAVLRAEPETSLGSLPGTLGHPGWGANDASGGCLLALFARGVLAAQ